MNFLRDVERNAFSLILSDDDTSPKLKHDNTYLNEIIPLIERTERRGTGLFVTDQFTDTVDIYQVDYSKINDVKGNFDFVIVNLNKSLIDKNEADKVKIILDTLLKVKNGGLIFVPKNTYQLMSSGRKNIEALIKVLDYKIEVPPHYIQDVIIASRLPS